MIDITTIQTFSAPSVLLDQIVLLKNQNFLLKNQNYSLEGENKNLGSILLAGSVVLVAVVTIIIIIKSKPNDPNRKKQKAGVSQ